jgi:hypothetical protein
MKVQRFSRREFIQLASQATVGVITASLLAGCIAPVAAQEAEINGAQLDVRVRGRGGGTRRVCAWLDGGRNSCCCRGASVDQ